METSRGDATAGPRATPWPDHGSSIGTDARLRYGGKPSAGVQKESTCERFLLFVRTKKGRRESSGSSEGASEDDAPPPPPPGRPSSTSTQPYNTQHGTATQPFFSQNGATQPYEFDGAEGDDDYDEEEMSL